MMLSVLYYTNTLQKLDFNSETSLCSYSLMLSDRQTKQQISENRKYLIHFKIVIYLNSVFGYLDFVVLLLDIIEFRLFQKLVVRTKFDIYVFTTYHFAGVLLIPTGVISILVDIFNNYLRLRSTTTLTCELHGAISKLIYNIIFKNPLKYCYIATQSVCLYIFVSVLILII